MSSPGMFLAKRLKARALQKLIEEKMDSLRLAFGTLIEVLFGAEQRSD